MTHPGAERKQGPDTSFFARARCGAGDYTEQTEYLRVFIGQLRKKIEPDPSGASLYCDRAVDWLSV